MECDNGAENTQVDSPIQLENITVLDSEIKEDTLVKTAIDCEQPQDDSINEPVNSYNTDLTTKTAVFNPNDLFDDDPLPTNQVDRDTEVSPGVNDNVQLDTQVNHDTDTEDHTNTNVNSDECPLASISTPDSAISTLQQDNHSPVRSQVEAMPQETPSSRRSMIPIRSRHEFFETPSLRPQSKIRAEVQDTNESQPRKCETVEYDQVPVTPSRRLTASEFNSFWERTQRTENVKRERIAHAKKVEDEQELATLRKSRQLSAREIRALNDRLVPKTPAPKQLKSNAPPPQTPANNPAIFNRLFELSTCKKPVVERQPEATPSVLSSRTQHLAARREIEKIKQAVQGTEFITEDEAMQIFWSLGIVDETSTENDHAVIQTVLHRCTTEEGISAENLQRRLVKAVTQKKCTKFQKLVTSRMAIARANEKVEITVEPEPEPEIHVAPVMQKETMDRLLARPVIPESVPEPEVVAPLISRASSEILHKSSRASRLQSLSLAERNQVLEHEKEQRISRMSQEIRQKEDRELAHQPQNLGALPGFYGALPESVRTRRPKIEARPEPSGKPSVTHYDDYLKKKSLINSDVARPPGWEKSVLRLRKGREDRDNIIEALDIRAPVKPAKNKQFSQWKKKVSHRRQEVEVEANIDTMDDILGL